MISKLNNNAALKQLEPNKQSIIDRLDDIVQELDKLHYDNLAGLTHDLLNEIYYEMCGNKSGV